MASLTDAITGVIKGAVSPISDLLTKKQEVREARQAANAALVMAQQQGKQEVLVNDQHLEAVLAANQATSWRDEYVTVSLVGIINATVLGGILQGFGYPEFLNGVLIGVETLSKIVDLKWAMNAAVASSLGFSIWRKI